ncbi:exosome complex exonuclease Rrp41 [Candidatus Micrarchaeota archaeon RBG_16_49_10]|nr:MAG: exosome complex exonuclease Rrp41 [Candidatus Micrarchaeota archaeon RBG_16_49_10]
MGKTEQKMIANGKRLDGRGPLDLREIEMKVGVIPNANGSSYVRFGKTAVIAGVYGPRPLFPRFLRESDTGILKVRYNMIPFSVDDRKRPGPSRRETEISKVIRMAFEGNLFLKNYPQTGVNLYLEVIEADGSTRVTSINAASLALADAGVPMRDFVVGLSGGKIDGTLILDLNGLEDNNSDADMPMAVLPTKKEVTLLQMDGRMNPEELKDLIKHVIDASGAIYEKQAEALRKKYIE